MEYNLSNRSHIYIYLYQLIPNIDIVKYIYSLKLENEYNSILLDRYNLIIKNNTVYFQHNGNYISTSTTNDHWDNNLRDNNLMQMRHTKFVKIDQNNMSKERIMESIETYELLDKYYSITYLGEFENYNNYNNLLQSLKIVHNEQYIKSIQSNNLNQYNIKNTELNNLKCINDDINEDTKVDSLSLIKRVHSLNTYFNYCNYHRLYRTDSPLIKYIHREFSSGRINLYYDMVNNVTYIST